MKMATATKMTIMGQFDDAIELSGPSPRGDLNGNLYHDDDVPVDDYEDDDDDDDDYYDYDEHDNPIVGSGAGGSSLSSSAMVASTKKMNFSHSVANTVTKMQDMEVKKRTLHTSRDDRATSEQCLDPRTRLMLFKMLSNGMLDEIDGCLSTGKEANVYYAKAGRKSIPTASNNNNPHNVTEFAIKIYKTSILVFKDRDKYVSGEHRWRKGYCK
jgi:RIO kinase 1